MNNFHINNRKALKKAVKSELIILTASVPVQKSLDQSYPFKQDNNFWYLTGIDEPSLILVICEDEEFLIVPTLSSVQESFDGKLNLAEMSKLSGVDQILSEKEGWLKIAKLLSSHPSVATIIPRNTLQKIFGIYPNPARKQLVTRLKRLGPKTQLEDISKVLASQRMVKQPIELEKIKKAIEITNNTLIEVLDKNSLSSLLTTKQLEAVINFGFISRGASAPAFESILAQGIKATTIHYTKNDQKLTNKDLLLIDVGCEYEHYCSDISRTISFGSPSTRQQAVYDAVKNVQSKLFKLVKSGLLFSDLENETVKLVGRELIKLGLIKSLDKKAIRKYYPHSVSHSLGLDVHDLADPTKPIPMGSVITIEPGIYIPEEGIGVRIEDDVLVKENSCQILSKELPTRLTLRVTN